jgi:purine-binding chemotaxis protein CheW
MTTNAESNIIGGQATDEFVTVMIAGQLFGLPIEQVQDVFKPDAITVVPLAAPEVAGVLNLRGRIVTAIDMRKRLNLPAGENGATRMAVGIESKGESYGIVIDDVGEVLRLPRSTFEANPANLDPRWASIASGVQRLEDELMVILDVKRVLDIGDSTQATQMSVA